jgi:NAD(P)-dependent dehydrogenase (short-subunit alcohol dehydrogenase family)
MALLDGKVAIVTGAGHGIGRAHALELARHGASVVVNDLGTSVTGDGADEKAADLTVDLIAQRDGTAVASYDDVSDYEAAGRMVQQAVDTYGKLDILVNNAGIVRDGAIWNMSETDFDAVIKVHVKGTWAPSTMRRATGGSGPRRARCSPAG